MSFLGDENEVWPIVSQITNLTSFEERCNTFAFFFKFLGISSALQDLSKMIENIQLSHDSWIQSIMSHELVMVKFLH